MTQFRNRKLYRLTDRRVFGGVCSGIAEYLELPVALVRALTVLALFVSFGITLILYIVMCFVVEAAPSGYRSQKDIGPEVSSLINQIDTQLKRRFDLIPNLVETVKGYMNHEQQTLTAVVEARNKFNNASNIEDKTIANDALTNGLKSIFAFKV